MSRINAEELLRLEVNLSQLERNINRIRKELKPGVKFMAVVKGNAYGHGLIPIGIALQEIGCHSLGVVRITEGIALREAGVTIPIVLLAPIMPSQAGTVIEYDITVMLDKESIALELNQCAKLLKKNVKTHIKINTGLNRFGIKPEEAAEYVRLLQGKCKNIELEGIYTHFSDPEFNQEFTERQIKIFSEVLAELEEAGMRPPIAHAAASGGILLYPQAQFDMVRCGILMYGEEYLKGRKILPAGVLPLTSLSSRITKILQVKAGEPIGYGDRHTAPKDCRIAVIAAGYGDGASRGWKQVLIHGQRAPVVNYSMDCLEADITNVTGIVQEYDEVVLIGKQGKDKITWEDACYGLNSEVDEQLQRITTRVPRIYYREE